MNDLDLCANYQEVDEDDYCVKLGKYIPGGCDQTYCLDIDQCPYRPEEIELN